MREIRVPTYMVGLLLAVMTAKTAAAEPAKLVIETIAGSGRDGDLEGVEGAATEVSVAMPFGVEVGPDSALTITSVGQHRVLRLDPSSGQLTCVAGNGTAGYSGDGGPATDAQLNEPYEVRFDRVGNMFIVEMQNHLVRRVDARSGKISTVAGTGSAGYGGDDGPATRAQFRQPHSIALDDRGMLYIADIGNHRIRRVDLASGTVTSIAGNGQREMPRDGQSAQGKSMVGPRALAITGRTLWIALREGHSIWRMDLDSLVVHHVAGTGKQGYTGDGGPAAKATFNGPKGIAATPDGRVYVVDTENQVIRMIDTRHARVFTVAGGGPQARGFAGENVAALDAQVDRPHGICLAPDGTVYLGDTNNHRVRWLHP
jgi:sugar lactone lactonase YvrE